MSAGDLHTEFERAARLAAAPPRCWHCGHPLDAGAGPMATCEDRAACFARSVAPPPGPRPHPSDTGACDPEEPACCDGCAAAYSEAWAEPDGEEEETT